LRMPMLTFRMYMGRAHSRLLASLTHPLSMRSGFTPWRTALWLGGLLRTRMWLRYRN
jgi:hypothetical protein